jgi:hypothetical protein
MKPQRMEMAARLLVGETPRVRRRRWRGRMVAGLRQLSHQV